MLDLIRHSKNKFSKLLIAEKHWMTVFLPPVVFDCLLVGHISPGFSFSCCVTTHDVNLSLVREFAQTGICVMERHAPVVFTNWVALILHTELQLRRMRRFHASEWIGGEPELCTFPPGSWTNDEGPKHPFLIKGNLFFFLPPCTFVLLVQRASRDVPEQECYCFLSCRGQTSQQHEPGSAECEATASSECPQHLQLGQRHLPVNTVFLDLTLSPSSSHKRRWHFGTK